VVPAEMQYSEGPKDVTLASDSTTVWMGTRLRFHVTIFHTQLPTIELVGIV